MIDQAAKMREELQALEAALAEVADDPKQEDFAKRLGFMAADLRRALRVEPSFQEQFAQQMAVRRG